MFTFNLFNKPQENNIISDQGIVTVKMESSSVEYIYLTKTAFKNVEDIGSFLLIINTLNIKCHPNSPRPNAIYCISKSYQSASGEIKCLTSGKTPNLNITVEWKPFEYPKIVIHNYLKKSCEVCLNIKVC